MRLNRNFWRLEARIDHLAAHLKEYEDRRLTSVECFFVERVLIQLQVEWEHFVRNVVLDSATGRFSNNGGLVVSGLGVTPKNREHAGNVLVSLYKKRRFEPDWYLPLEAIKAATKLKVSNATDIATHLGVTPWELDDLRNLRNFVTHRSKRSAIEVRSSAEVEGNAKVNPARICFTYQAGGIPRYVAWTRFMKYIGRQIVQ